MSIRMRSRNLLQTARQPLNISIHTVSDQMCNIARKLICFLDVSHGPPSANISYRHVGDLGNITANSIGIIIVNITDSIIDLYNMTRSILNRSMVVHAMFDDGGYTNNSQSSTTG